MATRSRTLVLLVHVRKVIGAARFSLIGQFIGEAMLLTFLSLLVALLLSAILLPAFNELTGKQLSLPVTQPVFWLALTGLLLVTGFVAGSYPAFFLSSLDPIKVLKGSLKFSWREILARRGLVVFQFSLTILLIVGMIVIYRQLNYIHNRELGFNRGQVMIINSPFVMGNQTRTFEEKLLHFPGVEGATMTAYLPTSDNRNDDALQKLALLL